MYRVERFQNGFTIATAEMAHMSSVSVGLWIGIGSRYEPAELNGVCHFIEHMLFKGTKKRSARESSQAVEGRGGYLNAFTGEETTCFHARAGAEHFEELLDVLMDMFLHSVFAAEEIGKERRVIKEEIAMYLDEPQHQVQELLNSTLWPNQPLGRPITGTGKTLDGLSRLRLSNYLRCNYVAGNTLLVATGRLKHQEVVRCATRWTRRLWRGAKPQFAAAENHQAGPRIHLHTKDTEQTQIALGFRTCARHDARRYAVRLLNAIIGENMSSRLFQVIREDHGLAYSIYSSPSFFHDTGDLVISAGLETSNLTKTLKLIAGELRRLIQSPPNRRELQRACDYVIGQMDLSLESTDNQMNWLGEQLLGFGRIFRPGEIKQKLRRLTPRQIQSAADVFFRPERLNLALVSPLKSDKHLAKSLQL